MKRTLAGARNIGRPSVVGIVAVIALGLSGCSSTSTSFPSGSGTATITWHGVGGIEPSPRPRPYQGTIAGIPVSGTSIVPVPSTHTGGSLPTLLVLARWTGTFEDKTFHLTISIDTAALSATSPHFTVDGSYGSDPVKATVTASSENPDSVLFNGTIGPHHVTGSVKPIEHGSSDKAVATFTVTG